MLRKSSWIKQWTVAITLSWLSLFMGSLAHAAAPDPLADIFSQQAEYLPVDDAFIFDFKQVGDKIVLDYTVAEGYYLYKDKFQFQAENASVLEVIQAPATQIEDEFFGVVEVYFFETQLTIQLKDIQKDAYLNVRYQGCAEAGFCYNPVVKRIAITELAASDLTAASISNVAANSSSETSTAPSSEQNQLADSLANESLLWTLVIFFGLGVGLAFTPCVFPMFPILSSIIAGQSNMSVKKGLWLAFVYVQGMALTYSLLGLVIASMGVQFQAALQHPAVLISVSIIFVLLAGAMFGFYNLQMPEKWTNKLTQVSNNQKSGNIAGVFVMGLLSGLIASPCTTAPLTGALLYVAQTGDMVVGFITLYVLSLGMGLPLLLIGASGGKLLPKAGNWMNVVKNLFGFVMLAIPLILLERIIDLSWVLGLSGILLLVMAAYFHSQYLTQSSANARSGFWVVALLSFLFGFLLLTKPISSVLLPATNMQQGNVPNGNGSNAMGANKHASGFKMVSTLAEIKSEITKAKAAGKPVMLDLYADWCTACKEFEAFTFADPSVKTKMSEFVMLQIDMTENNDADIEVMKAYDILGLPTILFFKNEQELTNQRVTGFMGAERFLGHLNNI